MLDDGGPVLDDEGDGGDGGLVFGGDGGLVFGGDNNDDPMLEAGGPVLEEGGDNNDEFCAPA